MPTFSFTYFVVYGDLLLFLPFFSRQRAVVLRDLFFMQLTMVWDNKLAQLLRCFRERGPDQCHKFTVEGLRIWTVCIFAIQPSMDRNIVVNFFEGTLHFMSKATANAISNKCNEWVDWMLEPEAAVHGASSENAEIPLLFGRSWPCIEMVRCWLI